jgi:hypothetical protein
MQRQMNWSEGKPSEYLLLNDATSVAAAQGQMRKAEELMQRSVQVSDRLGFKETTADTQSGLAGDEGRSRQRFESQRVGRIQVPSWHMAGATPVAVTLAMTGDTSRAQAITEALGHRVPTDTLLHQVNIPCVRAQKAQITSCVRAWFRPRSVTYF